ncbi:competence protein ComK [Crassaminicella indica]|uniref:Competence protein ComK n=1 Tax=Crassaminicella indica TaxID=2855394 RepID=A0ABX8RA75_9CLOT|nr:competence protein ComK [Crassaminicella indica]QXM05364.1 competence protein ComK [Crassaminicella indica]
MKNIDNIIKVGICALIPIYQLNMGNVTKLITEDGRSFIDKRTMKTVLKIIARYYTIHIEACREKYGQVLHQRLSVPILFHQRLLLIPFKMRKPKFVKDGAKGYINLYDIEKVTEKEKYVMIQLKNGVEIAVLNKMKTVQDQINKAKLIASDMNCFIDDLSYRSRDFYIEYNRPATKGDVARLQEELVQLKDVLKKMLRF